MKNKESEVLYIFDEEGATLEQILEDLFYEFVLKQLNLEEI